MITESFETLEFFRGMSKPLTNGNNPVIISTNKNRQPKDMPIHLHNQADKWFETEFGIRYRSQALFVTSSKFIATQYAKDKDSQYVFRIIPLGSYKFCWSSNHADLLAYLQVEKNMSITEFLNKANYSESALKAAHDSGHELMLFCEKYIAIPCTLLLDETEESKVTPKKSIIIV